MAEAGPALIFDDLMAAVGTLVFHWGRLETEIDADLGWRAGPSGHDPADGFAESLDRWLALVEAQEPDPDRRAAAAAMAAAARRLALARNRIVHGLTDGDSRPPIGEPYVEGVGERTTPDDRWRYTLAELESLAARLKACAGVVRTLRLASDWQAPPAAGA